MSKDLCRLSSELPFDLEECELAMEEDATGGVDLKKLVKVRVWGVWRGMYGIFSRGVPRPPPIHYNSSVVATPSARGAITVDNEPPKPSASFLLAHTPSFTDDHQRARGRGVHQASHREGGVTTRRAGTSRAVQSSSFKIIH